MKKLRKKIWKKNVKKKFEKVDSLIFIIAFIIFFVITGEAVDARESWVSGSNTIYMCFVAFNANFEAILFQQCIATNATHFWPIIVIRISIFFDAACSIFLSLHQFLLILHWLASTNPPMSWNSAAFRIEILSRRTKRTASFILDLSNVGLFRLYLLTILL